MIVPKLPDRSGPIQVTLPIGTEPGDGKSGRYIHVRAYHVPRCKRIKLRHCEDESIELDVPYGFYLEHLEAFMAENGERLYDDIQLGLDEQWDDPPEPLSYDSKIPFLGEYVPIRMLPDDSDSNGYFDDGAVYLKPGLSSGKIRRAVLDIFGNIAYEILKKRLDHYANIMGVSYSVLKINDGRRTFGSYNMETHVIFLSRRALMLSIAAIDSLIIHELAHIKEFGHNEEFLDEILKIMPDYLEVDKAAIDFMGQLFEEGWI